jgi:hypothetical protein
LYVEFDGIKFYRTSPHELNKNAIVERMIKTLKKYLLDILMTFSIKQLYQKFVEQKLPLTFVDYLLDFACEINNNKLHRTIKTIPTQVFNELETNKQKINLMYYPLYPHGTIVIKVPESKGQFSNRIFNFDPEPYVVYNNVGRKFKLLKLIDMIEYKTSNVSSKDYQPYEIKTFKTGREFMTYINSELIKNSLIKLYGKKRYDKIIEWFKPRIKEYDQMILNAHL